jgi:hypothetical protein
MTTVKIAFRGDIRRVTVSDFASLLASAGTTYKLEDFVLKYKDADGDWVSIASAEEFEEATKAAEGKQVLKLFIFVPKSLRERKAAEEEDSGVSFNGSSSSSSSSSSGSSSKEEDVVSSKEEAPPAPCPPPVPPRDPLDHGVACHSCGVRIIGTLYQCTVCPGVSVCSSCEERNVHDSTHTLMKVRVPTKKCNKPQRGGAKVQKWGCRKLKKLRCVALPLIFIAVLRHLPFMICLLAIWAGFQFMQRRHSLLKVCSECTHKESCRVGKKAAKSAKGNGFRLVPKIMFTIACLFVRILPIWLLAVCIPLVVCACRKLRRMKKGVCVNNFRSSVDSMCGRYRDILQLSWPQLMHRVQQNQVPRGGVPQSVVGCAAVAASESLAASIAAVVALGESVAAELGVNIPVAVPVNATPYAQQTRILKEMGFEDTSSLQQLLVKHSGNIQAVISEVMQFKPARD